MNEADPRSERPGTTAFETPYVRFIILSGPRTGSNLLALALNSHPEVTCFGEVFNFTLDFVTFNVEGYDNLDPADLALQRRDPQQFLRERIFGKHPNGTRAVGLKYHYGQLWGHQALQDGLTGDKGLRVLHLRRRNLLRAMLSLKIAEQTGVWVVPTGRKLTLANVGKAFRHPGWAAQKLSALLPRMETAKSRAPAGVSISPEELYEYIIRMEITRAKFDDLFREHPTQTILYEDLQRDCQAVFDQTQAFLGVKPRPLAVALQKQNPQPLRELLANYDELHKAFGSGDHGWMFEDG